MKVFHVFVCDIKRANSLAGHDYYQKCIINEKLGKIGNHVSFKMGIRHGYILLLPYQRFLLGLHALQFGCTLPLLANASTLSFKFLLLVHCLTKFNPNTVWILKVLYFPYFDFSNHVTLWYKIKKERVLPIFCSTYAHFVKMLFRWFCIKFFNYSYSAYKTLLLEREGLIHHCYDICEFFYWYIHDPS